MSKSKHIVDHRKRQMNRYRLKKDYNLSLMEYQRLIDKSGGRCAICENDEKDLVIDHDHKTGKVRGLLCRQCNSGLGMFGDSMDILKAAILYLM